ncbi:MAG: TonB family protein [Nitrospiraceae bacterium]|nr:TonB family protein [Nitrospiraceae bacterium]
MALMPSYQEGYGLSGESREGDQWAFRWFILVSFLVHSAALALFLKDPAFHQTIENMIAAKPKALSPLAQKKLAEEKKPVFIDLVDPSKVPIRPQSSAPLLPKGFSINGKPKGVEHRTVHNPPMPKSAPRTPLPPEVLARTEAPRAAPKADKAPGFRQVHKSKRHEKPNKSKAETDREVPRPDMKEAARKESKVQPEKPVIRQPLTKQQIQKILAQESLGNPLTRHLDLSKEVAPAYSDRQSELDRIAANLEDETYSSYIRRIQERFETIGEYPPDAAARGTTGRALVTFTINADGTLAHIALTQSSGSRALDEESLRIVRVAAPYIPLPVSFHKTSLTLTWAFIYYNGGFHVIQ